MSTVIRSALLLNRSIEKAFTIEEQACFLRLLGRRSQWKRAMFVSARYSSLSLRPCLYLRVYYCATVLRPSHNVSRGLWSYRPAEVPVAQKFSQVSEGKRRAHRKLLLADKRVWFDPV